VVGVAEPGFRWTCTLKMAEEERSLEQTPTWAVASVATVFVLVSLLLERGLHRLGKVKALSVSVSLSLSSLPSLAFFLDEEMFSTA
jgi:hypothetical protein